MGEGMTIFQKVFHTIKQRRVYVPVLIGCIVIAVVGSGGVLWFGSYIMKVFAEEEKTLLLGAVSTFDEFTDQICSKALQKASIFAHDERVIEALKMALKGDISNPEDEMSKQAREYLKKEFAHQIKTYKSLVGRPLRVHVHLNRDGQVRSLWRFWKSEQRVSDDISAFRHTLWKIQKDPSHKPIVGIEIGRSGMVLRGIVPVIGHNNEYLGSVEYLEDFDDALKFLKRNLGIESYMVVMLKKYLDIATRLQDNVRHPIVFGNYVYVTGGGKCSIEGGSCKHVKAEAFDRVVNSGKDYHIIVGSNAIILHPIKDYQGKVIGILGISKNISSFLNVMKSLKTRMLALVFFIPLLAALMIVAIVVSVVKDLFEVGNILVKNTDEIDKVSLQLSDMGKNLSDISNQNAASLEETASALEEVSSQTQSNVEKSKLASSKMEEAAGTISRSKAMLERITKSMDEVARASEKTVNVVKVIDEIAFQTNLLALNAAVEAARAGEAGSGFAVVAEEVRNLAMRSAEAAKNSADLIQSAVESIREGVKLIKELNEAFVEVAESSSETARLMGEVRDASEEQAISISHINKAVSELDKTTQQNAQDAESLLHTAQELTELVGKNKEAVEKIADVVGLRFDK